jgi:hypothetical protein
MTTHKIHKNLMKIAEERKLGCFPKISTKKQLEHMIRRIRNSVDVQKVHELKENENKLIDEEPLLCRLWFENIHGEQIVW